MKQWMAALMAAMLLTAGTALSEAPAGLGGRTKQQAFEELIVGTATAPNGDFMNGAWSNNTTDMDVRALLHGYGLVRWDNDNGAFVPNETAVSGITSQADRAGNKVFTVALSDGLTYSDGTPITSADYVFSMLLGASDELRQMGGMDGSQRYLLGADSYQSGQAKALAGVRMLSERMFSVTVKAEYLPFFYELGLLDVQPYPIAEIAPGCRVADQGEGAYIENIDQEIPPLFTADLLRQTVLDPATGYRSHPRATSGPYQLLDYDAERGLCHFQLNPYFKGTFDGRKPTIQRITLRTARPEEMVGLLDSGEVDLLNKCVQADMIDGGSQLVAAGKARRGEYLRSGLSMISFDCKEGPGQFEAVRQAVALCLNRDEFLGSFVKNYGVAVNGYYGIGQWMVRMANGQMAQPDGEEPAGGTGLSLDGLDTHAFDPEAARSLLVKDGWTLDQKGNPFEQGKDKVRCKRQDDQLIPLRFALAVPEGNEPAAQLEQTLCGPLRSIGAQIEIRPLPFPQLLQQYYGQAPRECNLFYLGTNFASVFDPSRNYSADGEGSLLNTSGLQDKLLSQLAWDLHKTEPGDTRGYLEKWLAFQTRWNRILPAVPVYSNIYMDFYTPRLQGYQITRHTTWADAVVYADLTEAGQTDEEPVSAVE